MDIQLCELITIHEFYNEWLCLSGYRIDYLSSQFEYVIGEPPPEGFRVTNARGGSWMDILGLR